MQSWPKGITTQLLCHQLQERVLRARDTNGSKMTALQKQEPAPACQGQGKKKPRGRQQNSPAHSYVWTWVVRFGCCGVSLSPLVLHMLA